MTHFTDHQQSPAPASLVLADQGVTHGAGDPRERASLLVRLARFAGPGLGG